MPIANPVRIANKWREMYDYRGCEDIKIDFEDFE